MASAAGAAGVIAILTLFSRIVGFGRTVGESWVLGATPTADAYATANNVPNVLFEVAAGGALAGVVVPLLSRCLARGDREEVNRTASALVTWVVAVGVPIAVLVAAFAEPLASVLLAGRHDGVISMAALLLRIFAVQVPLYGLSVVFSGILQAHRRFVLPALAPMLSSIVVIGAFAMFWVTGGSEGSEVPAGALLWLGWGTTAGVIAFTVPQLIPVLRLVSLRPTLRFPDGVGAKVVSMASAGFGGLLAQQAAIVLIMVVANTTGGVGAFPIYKYAQALYFLPYAILAVPIATSLFPRISERAALPGRPGLAEFVGASIRFVTTVSVIGAGVLIAVAAGAARVFTLVFEMPELEAVVSILAFGIVGYSLLYHTSRVLYALDCPGAVLRVTVAGWAVVCVGVLSAIPLAAGRALTLYLLAASTAVGMSVAGVLGVRACRRAIGPAVTSGLVRTLSIVVPVSILSAFIGKLACSFVLDVGAGMLPAVGGAVVGAAVAGAIPIGVALRADSTTWRMRSWAAQE